MQTKIYHNPRCRKSREGLQLLEEKGIEFEIIKYVDTPPSRAELKRILDLLEMQPMDLIRTNEKIWKENFKGRKLGDEELIQAMHQHPKLIERPIVIHQNKAVVGRPVDNILKLFQ